MGFIRENCNVQHVKSLLHITTNIHLLGTKIQGGLYIRWSQGKWNSRNWPMHQSIHFFCLCKSLGHQLPWICCPRLPQILESKASMLALDLHNIDHLPSSKNKQGCTIGRQNAWLEGTHQERSPLRNYNVRHTCFDHIKYTFKQNMPCTRFSKLSFQCKTDFVET